MKKKIGFKSQVVNSKSVRVWERSAFLTCGEASWRIGEGELGERGDCGERNEPNEPAAKCGREGGSQASPAGLPASGRGQTAGGQACPGNCPLEAVQRDPVLRAESAALGGFRLLLTWPEAKRTVFADAARSELERRRANLGARGSVPTRPR